MFNMKIPWYQLMLQPNLITPHTALACLLACSQPDTLRFIHTASKLSSITWLKLRQTFNPFHIVYKYSTLMLGFFFHRLVVGGIAIGVFAITECSHTPHSCLHSIDIDLFCSSSYIQKQKASNIYWGRDFKTFKRRKYCQDDVNSNYHSCFIRNCKL